MVILTAFLKIQTLVFLFASLFVFLKADFTSYLNTSHVNVVRCIEKERQALLKFKDGVVDPSGFLSLWVGYDCCTWKSVTCGYPTGHVVSLDLSNPKCYSECLASRAGKCSFCLQGKFSKHIEQLQYLSYLNVSNNEFSGLIPGQIGNLSNLHVLDLNSVGYGMYVSDLIWISDLSSLKYLGLSDIDLGFASDHWLQAINSIPSLVELHLFNTELKTIPYISPHHLNLSSLSVLDLSANSFESQPTRWLLNLSTNLVVLKLSECDFISPISSLFGGNLPYNHSDYKLEELDISGNRFSGDLKDSLEHLKSIRMLDLSFNNISGSLPTSIENFSKLEILKLASNKMNGFIPKSLKRLEELKVLDLFDNEWEGSLSQDLFQSLRKLRELSISSRSVDFHLNLTRNWVPQFSLTTIYIEDQDLGPEFPTWLQNQSQLESIALRNVSISDTIARWQWRLFPRISELDLSYNQIRGTIPVNIAQIFPSLEYCDLSWNFFSGSIPSSIGRLDNLYFLSLSNNQLSGKLPYRWPKSMFSVDLSSNELSGKFPKTLCSSPDLFSLKLKDNRLSGKITFSLTNCRSLMLLDLRGNKFFGSIPKWTEETQLRFLSLRNNFLNGSISDHVCNIPNLHILDLAQNNFSGCIPACLSELHGMKHAEDAVLVDSMVLNLKGTEYIYNPSTLRIVKDIDLSCNSLSGVIPEEIMSLKGLGTLNLSNNDLTGKIPSKIGEMRNLEVLDLSSNHFYGQIPASMSSLTFLNHLNLSHNNFSGPIPSGTQLSSFDKSIYEGNLRLCGNPLPTKCESHFVQEEGRHDLVDEKEHGKLGLFVSIALGFIFGFWSICGSLALKKSWRDAYFGIINNIVDWIVVIVALVLNHLQKMITRDIN